MATYHIHLKNLPPNVTNLDIWQFFIDIDVPDDGVQIIGGPEGEGFVSFLCYEDLLRATGYDKRPLRGIPISLTLVNSGEKKKRISEIRESLIRQSRDVSSQRDRSPDRYHSPLRGPLPGSSGNWGRPAESNDRDQRESDFQWQRPTHQMPWQRTDDDYDERAVKRPRYSDQDDRYSQNEDSDVLLFKLKRELQDAQNIQDQLAAKKERIERLEREHHERKRREIEDQRRPPDAYNEPMVQRLSDSYIEPRMQRDDMRFDDHPQQRPQDHDDRYDCDERDGYRGRHSPDRYHDDADRHFDRPRSRSPHRPPTYEREADQDMMSYSAPGYVMVTDVPRNTKYRDIKQFFKGYQIAPQGMVMKKDDHQNTYTVYIKFVKLDDALECDRKNHHHLLGREINIEVVSPYVFDEQHGKEMNPAPPLIEPLMAGPLMPEPLMARQVMPTQELSLQEKIKCAPAYTGKTKQALYYVYIKNLPEDATADSVWHEFGGPWGKSDGAIVIFDINARPHRSGYIAYRNYDDRNQQVLSREDVTPWKDRTVYTKIGKASRHGKIFMSTLSGQDIEMPEKMRQIFAEKFGQDPPELRRSLREREEEQHDINRCSKSLFETKEQAHSNDARPLRRSREAPSTSGRHEAPPPRRPEEEAEDPQTLYLRLNGLREETTACTVWSWFGGAGGGSPGVKLVCRPDVNTEGGVFIYAFVAFNNKHARNTARTENPTSKTFSERQALRSLAIVVGTEGVEIYESTRSGNDRRMSYDEKVALRESFYPTNDVPVDEPHEEGELYYLRLPGIRTASASKIASWFKHLKVKSVTLMDYDKKTRITKSAFVGFEDARERNKEKAKRKEFFPNLESMNEKKMLKIFASCALDTKIYTSTSGGEDRLVTREERNALKERFFPEDGMSKREGIAVKPQDEDSELQTTPSAGSEAVEDISKGAKVQENSDDKSQANYYLKLSRIELDDVCDSPACEVWSWFGGKEGSSLGVIFFRKDGESGESCLVAFKDPVSRMEMKNKFPEAKAINRRQALRTIGYSHDDTDIYRSTDTGVDKSVTEAEKLAAKQEFLATDSVPKASESKQPESNEKPPLLDTYANLEYVKLTVHKPNVTAHGLCMQNRGCKSVTLIKDSTGKPVLTYIGYARKVNPKAVKWQKNRDRELAGYDSSFQIVEATPTMKDRIITEEEKSEFIARVKSLQRLPTNSAHPNQTLPKPPILQGMDLDYVRLTGLPSSVNAYGLWIQNRGCLSVTLLKNPQGEGILAFIAYEKYSNENASIGQKGRDLELAGFNLDHQIVESTGLIGDRIVSNGEREEFKTAIRNSRLQPKKPPPRQRPPPQLLPPGRLNTRAPVMLQNLNLEYIRMTELHPDIKASELWESYPGCTVVHQVNNADAKAVLAFVGYERKVNSEADVWQKKRDRELAGYGLDYRIIESTGAYVDKLITDDERYTFWDKVDDMNARDRSWQKKQEQQWYQEAERY